MNLRPVSLAAAAFVLACGSRSGLVDPGISASGATGGLGGGTSGSGGALTGGAGGTSGAGGASGGSAGSGATGGTIGCVYSDVVAGGSHTCALGPSGEVYCFGANQFGQVGDGLPGNDAPIPKPLSGPNDFVALGAGEFHSAGVRKNGNVMGWGHNALGVLGDGTQNDSAVPVPTKNLKDAVEVSHGMVVGHACALRATGTLACWGENSHGELGNGTVASSPLPVPVNGAGGSISVAVGYLFSCAVSGDGSVHCWGWNASGALGIGSSDAASYPNPKQLPGFGGALRVVAGNHYGCALRSDGSVWCWGYNGHGQLGNGSNVENQTSPGPVAGLSDAVWLSGGSSHVCAVKKNGSVSCWGRNYFGQLGNGTSADTNLPSTVVGITDATRVSAGGEHTCALSQSQGLLCWGANDSGQLGNGTTDKSLVPTKVGCPAAACQSADPDYVKSHFVPCPDGKHIGQVASAPGVSCAEVCCVFGFAGCSYRAAQAGFAACTPASPQPSGTCAEVFQDSWSSQCACAP